MGRPPRLASRSSRKRAHIGEARTATVRIGSRGFGVRAGHGANACREGAPTKGTTMAIAGWRQAFSIGKFAALGVIATATSFGSYARAADAPPQRCETVVKADVVALDEAFQVNRLGTTRTDGEIYALRTDVVSTDGAGGELKPGHVMLRPDKRPRPMVLRANAGSCVEITFTNLLDPKQKD